MPGYDCESHNKGAEMTSLRLGNLGRTARACPRCHSAGHELKALLQGLAPN